jgi:pyruvate ferredoxin oxidoreductase gamma subunit
LTISLKSLIIAIRKTHSCDKRIHGRRIKLKQIKLYGLGGQGVVTAAKILSIAVSIYEDAYANMVPAFGHERRGAPVFTDLMIDNEPVLMNCFVYEPDIVVVFDDTMPEKRIDVGAGITTEAILILNTTSEETAKQYKDTYGFKDVYYVDGTKIALDTIGKGIQNGAMLGALASTGALRIDSVATALKEYFGDKGGGANAESARKAYEETKKM